VYYHQYQKSDTEKGRPSLASEGEGGSRILSAILHVGGWTFQHGEVARRS
tara:strand:+ start:1408 stop:1557 length:150 start_codon:yes stop_codon:yes gene_type:complete